MKTTVEVEPQVDESVIHISGLTKRYGDLVAVDHLSFDVRRGEVFGLLGPNGAGKTTTIRMIMGIYGADEGQVTLFGGHPQAGRERVGYLPEERGLYLNDRVIDVLTYMAELKGVNRRQGRERAQHWLDRMGLGERATDRLQAFSRGMRQKVQIITCLVHEPELVIFDEPFQGLDPVNVRQVRDLIRDLERAGKTVVLSSHQLNLVEAVCDRIALMSGGRAVEYGEVDAIRRRYSPLAVWVETPAGLDDLPHDLGTVATERDGFRFELEGGAKPQDLLRRLVAEEILVHRFEPATASLEDVFVKVVSGGDNDA